MLDEGIAGQSVRLLVTLPAGFFNETIDLNLITRVIDCDILHLEGLADFAGVPLNREWMPSLSIRKLTTIHFLVAILATGNPEGWARDALLDLITNVDGRVSVGQGEAVNIDIDDLCQTVASTWDNDDLRGRHGHVARTLRHSLYWIRWLHRTTKSIQSVV